MRSRTIWQNFYPWLNLYIVISKMRVLAIHFLSSIATIIFVRSLKISQFLLKILLHQQTGQRAEIIDVYLLAKLTPCPGTTKSNP